MSKNNDRYKYSDFDRKPKIEDIYTEVPRLLPMIKDHIYKGRNIQTLGDIKPNLKDFADEFVHYEEIDEEKATASLVKMMAVGGVFFIGSAIAAVATSGASVAAEVIYVAGMVAGSTTWISALPVSLAIIPKREKAAALEVAQENIREIEQYLKNNPKVSFEQYLEKEAEQSAANEHVNDMFGKMNYVLPRYHEYSARHNFPTTTIPGKTGEDVIKEYFTNCAKELKNRNIPFTADIIIALASKVTSEDIPKSKTGKRVLTKEFETEVKNADKYDYKEIIGDLLQKDEPQRKRHSERQSHSKAGQRHTDSLSRSGDSSWSGSYSDSLSQSRDGEEKAAYKGRS